MENTIVTYKYYDNKARRIALMAVKNPQDITITEIVCSKKDRFCKACSREALEQVYNGITPTYIVKTKTEDGFKEEVKEYHPITHTIDADPDQQDAFDRNWKNIFFAWANEKFNRHRTMVGLAYFDLIQGANGTKILKIKPPKVSWNSLKTDLELQKSTA